MYKQGQFGAQAYARIGDETGVVDASPQRLGVLLFEGARKAIALARMHMRAGNVAEKGAQISKASRIIVAGLKEGLDMQRGGELAVRLAGHYDFLNHHLTQANIKNDEQMLIDADRHLSILENAWRSASPAVVRAAAPVEA
jgi:flagellar protein FliS